MTSLLFLSYLIPCPYIPPIQHFNTSEYIRATWYIQQQQITDYQPKESLFCVAQTLNQSNKKILFYSGKVIDVYNYGNLNEVNGSPENYKNTTLCARQPNQRQPSQLINAPCFLPNILAGPYWIIAVGPNNTHYEWAIISGGPPTVKYPDGNCSTSLKGVNGSGLWLFTRERNGIKYIPKMRSILINLGYTTSQLLDVNQTNCKYEGAYIKSN